MAARSKKTDPRLAKIYAEVKRNFTAADLAKYTEVTPTVPARQVLAELEETYRKDISRKSKKNVNKRNGHSNGRKKSA